MQNNLLLDEVGMMTLLKGRTVGQSEKITTGFMQVGNTWRYMKYLTLAERCCNIKRLVPVS